MSAHQILKYNLALTPISKNNEVTSYARQLSKLADKYLLGKNSLPHITLYQFEAEAGEIENIWRHVRDLWKKDSIDLEFKEFSCITFDEVIFWVSLLPNNCDQLHRMHQLIAQALGKPIKQNFDPHMTLVNTKNKNYEAHVNILKRSYKPISDRFVLSLGSSDDVGQLVKIF